MIEVYNFSIQTLYYWLVAFSLWEAVFVVIFPKINKGKSIFEYYRKLPSWIPISGDFLYSTLIFIAAQGIFGYINPINYKLPIFAFIFVALQWIFDLTYSSIILRLPSTTSQYINFFQRYIKEVGFGAAIGDSIYLLIWLFVTWLLLKYVPINIATFILIFMLFIWLVIGY